MAAKHAHVALTAAHFQYITSQVAEGRYASVSWVERATLRLLIARDDAQTHPPADAVPAKHGEA